MEACQRLLRKPTGRSVASQEGEDAMFSNSPDTQSQTVAADSKGSLTGRLGRRRSSQRRHRSHRHARRNHERNDAQGDVREVTPQKAATQHVEREPHLPHFEDFNGGVLGVGDSHAVERGHTPTRRQLALLGGLSMRDFAPAVFARHVIDEETEEDEDGKTPNHYCNGSSVKSQGCNNIRLRLTSACDSTSDCGVAFG